MLTIVSWDSLILNNEVYQAGFSPADIWGLPDVNVEVSERTGSWPVVGTVTREKQEITFYVVLARNTSVIADRATLLAAFDPEDETPKRLVITDRGGGRVRYKEALCSSIRPVLIGSVASRELFKVTVVVHGDVRWRSVTSVTDIWNITASGQSRIIDSACDNKVFPTYQFKPTVAKTGESYIYRRWVPIAWKSRNSGYAYPVMFELNTAALVTASKMRADGFDLRVTVDGSTQSRWIFDMNEVDTKIWITLDFNRAPQISLSSEIAAAGAIASIEVDDAVELALMPDTGIVYIENEAFVYRQRDLVGGALTGISRAAKGTSAALHIVGTDVYWIQKEVYIIYGKADATDPGYSLFKSPAFSWDSNNDIWEYEYTFGNATDFKAARWVPSKSLTISGLIGCYTKTQREMEPPTDDFTRIGAWRAVGNEAGGPNTFSAGWQLSNPCGIVNVGWFDGIRRAVNVTEHNHQLRYWSRGASWWTLQFRFADPALPHPTFEACSAGPAVSDWAPASAIALQLYAYDSDIEFGYVVVFLNSSEVPEVSVGNEEGNYRLNCILSNDLESIAVDFLMDLDEVLEVDTVRKVVTYLKDNSTHLPAVVTNTVRKDMLALQPGSNTLVFTDAGTQAVTLTTVYSLRNY